MWYTFSQKQHKYKRKICHFLEDEIEDLIESPEKHTPNLIQTPERYSPDLIETSERITPTQLGLRMIINKAKELCDFVKELDPNLERRFQVQENILEGN